jgi:hypothetical protein
MMKKWIRLDKRYLGKDGKMISVLKFSYYKYKIKTKDVLKTINKTGDLLYFRPEYLLKMGLIDKLEMLELYGYRQKYGKIKVSILELK